MSQPAKARTLITFQLDDEALAQLTRVMEEQELSSLNKAARAVITGAIKGLDLSAAVQNERINEIALAYRQWYVGRVVVFLDELRDELIRNVNEGKSLQELGKL